MLDSGGGGGGGFISDEAQNRLWWKNYSKLLEHYRKSGLNKDIFINILLKSTLHRDSLDKTSALFKPSHSQSQQVICNNN